MILKVLTVVLAVVMSLGLWHAAPAHSQDLGAELQAALAANLQAVETIGSAEVAASPDASRALVLQAVDQAQVSRASLLNALELATTDEQRSRIEGLLDHLEAAINAGLRASSAPDDVIRNIVDAVRGELVEALREIQPFAPEVTRPEVTPGQPAPQQLPRAGSYWVDSEFLLLLATLGAAALLVGLRIRVSVRPT